MDDNEESLLDSLSLIWVLGLVFGIEEVKHVRINWHFLVSKGREQNLTSAYSVYIANQVFVKQSASVPLVYHLEDPKVLLQSTDLWSCPFSVLDHPLEKSFKLWCLYILECVLGITKSCHKTKSVLGEGQ